jgi:hypothetical protein
MAKKDLKFFMRSTEPEIVTAPGPASIKDENGDPVMFEIKVLTQAEIQRINDNYRTRKMATDKRGNPLVQNGEVVFRTDKDNQRATRHMIVEALQYPNLKDPDLMQHYNCVDITEMPLLVFSRADEFEHVVRIVMAALGLGDFGEDETEKIEQAKN